MIIYITDINDNPAQFDKPVYEIFISEATSVQTPVSTLTVTDKDLASNTLLQYSLDGQNDDG